MIRDRSLYGAVSGSRFRLTDELLYIRQLLQSQPENELNVVWQAENRPPSRFLQAFHPAARKVQEPGQTLLHMIQTNGTKPMMNGQPFSNNIVF
jgi:hypothetical protein